MLLRVDGETFEPPKLPGLENDLLRHWLERTKGASALQYLFMGGCGTHSRLHVDPGGAASGVAPTRGTPPRRHGGLRPSRV